MLDWTPQPPYTAEQLLQVIRILRDPENGCPWDKVQTHASIRKNFLEETCEALEAIDADDAVLLREELGDVLMQVVFHAAIEEERGRFTFEDVCRNVCEKLVFRHPNIFASSAAENAGINGWDALKNKEKGRTTLADELATVPATLPALMRAQKLQKRAAGHGLGQQDAAAAQHRLEAAVRSSTTHAELLDSLTTVRYPRARMRRLAMDAALDYSADAFPALPPYLHLLGAQKDALSLLKAAALPVSHSLARLAEQNAPCRAVVDAQLRACDFGALCRKKPGPMGSALRQKIIFLTN